MAWIVSFKIRDNEGAEFSVPYYLPASTEYDDAVAWGLAVGGAIDDTINGRVESYSVQNTIPLSVNVKAAPLEGSRVDAGATLSFRNSASRAWSNYIPSFLSTKIINGLVVTTDAEVVALRNLIVTGSLTALPTDENGLDLTELTHGKQSTRK